jgi:UDP-N-acetylglucosamine transferase subunit ALG13
VMPRRLQLGEIRNDHQLATAKWLRQMPGVTVVDDTEELVDALRRGEWKEPGAARAEASPELLVAVREFIECR